MKKLTQIKYLLVKNELKKLKTFDSIYFSGKSQLLQLNIASVHD